MVLADTEMEKVDDNGEKKLLVNSTGYSRRDNKTKANNKIKKNTKTKKNNMIDTNKTWEKKKRRKNKRKKIKVSGKLGSAQTDRLIFMCLSLSAMKVSYF